MSMKNIIHGTQHVANWNPFAPATICPTSPSLGVVAVDAGCSVTVTTGFPSEVAVEVPITVALWISMHPLEEQIVPLEQQAPPVA